MYIYIVFQQEINFICKSFRLRLYQLHTYNKILLQLSNLQIVFYKFRFFIITGMGISV